MILQKWVFKIGLIISVSVLFLHAQSKSAIEFYDTTGVTPTAKFGWTGDAGTGKFFIQTPGDANGVSVKAGNVTATKFTGDGSGLTGVTAAAPSVAGIVGLKDSLGRKADTAWVNGKIGGKADISSVTATNGSGLTAGTTAGAVTIGTDATIAKKTDLTPMNDSITSHRTAINSKVSQGQTAGGDLSGTYPNPTIGTGKIVSTHLSTALTNTINGKVDTNYVNGKIPATGIEFYQYSQSSSSIANFPASSTISTGSITVSAPSAGYLIVSACAQIFWDNTSTSGYAVEGTVTNSSTDLGGYRNMVAGNPGLYVSWSQTRVFTIASAGSYTYNLLFLNLGNGDQRIGNSVITAYFSATRL